MGIKLNPEVERKIHEMAGLNPPDISEEAFQGQVITLAHDLGWRVAHFRKVRVQRKDGSVYWQTPVQADGAGWPDLVLTNGKRVIYAELKLRRGTLSSSQYRWKDDLVGSGVEFYVWKPKDLDQIKQVLGEVR